MGLLDKIRGELVDIVEWLDHTRDTLVWRFPRFHNQIKNGAQLIVRPGQMAVFVHRGQLADVFEPGNYVLKTDNLPILSTLQGWKHGFDSPFKAEVYFVNTKRFTDLKWGTKNPIMLRDPEFGPVRLRAFGTYAIRVTDPAKFIREIVGTDGNFTTDEVTNQKFVSGKAERPQWIIGHQIMGSPHRFNAGLPLIIRRVGRVGGTEEHIITVLNRHQLRHFKLTKITRRSDWW